MSEVLVRVQYGAAYLTGGNNGRHRCKGNSRRDSRNLLKRLTAVQCVENMEQG
jgi:hypothetical protein